MRPIKIISFSTPTLVSIIAALFFYTCHALGDEPTILEKHYNGFTVWLDCSQRGATAFKYTLDEDTGNQDRSNHEFILDPSVSENCQPKIYPEDRTSYRTDAVDTERTGTYDNGHLVPANHMDSDRESFDDTFYVTNILPQQSSFNQTGAWRHTENISECYRDITPLTIWGGVIWGDDTTDDFFVATHGIATPDFWWKVIHRHDTDDFIVWIFPNDKSAKKGNIDDYIKSLDDLIPQLNFVPDFGDLSNRSNEKASTSWPVGKSGRHNLTCEDITTSMG